MGPNGRCSALLILTVGLLLPGALDGQRPAPASVPSLEGIRGASPSAPHVRQAARLQVGPVAVHASRLPAFAAFGDPRRGVRWGTPALAAVEAPEPPSVLSAVLALAVPREDDGDDVRDGLGGLGDLLPRELCRDLMELRARIQRYRTVLFGQRGIVRWGELDGSEGTARVRLNLQTDPDPGFRVTLVTS